MNNRYFTVCDRDTVIYIDNITFKQFCSITSHLKPNLIENGCSFIRVIVKLMTNNSIVLH